MNTSLDPLSEVAPLQMSFVGVGVVLLACAAARLAIEAHRRRRAPTRDRRFDEPGPSHLRAGFATLAGTVETDDPGGVPIRACARYGGIAHCPGEPPYAVPPFTLVVAGTGARVRVQPEGDVALVGAAEGESTGPASKHDGPLAFTLRPGERVIVTGTLAPWLRVVTGYRSDAHHFVLRAPRGGALEIERERFAGRR